MAIEGEPCEALPDSCVLGIEGEQACAGFERGLGDEFAGGDEGLFVGERDIDTEFDGAEGGSEPRDADDCADDEIALDLFDEAGRGVVTGSKIEPRGGRVWRVAQGDIAHAPLLGLLRDGLVIRARGEPGELEAGGIGTLFVERVEMRHHLEGLCPDGSGGSEQEHAFRARLVRN